MNPTTQQLSQGELASIAWRVSSLSGSGSGGSCVEVGTIDDGTRRVAVRHSHHPDGPVIVYTAAEWAAFTGGVRNGEFDY